MIISNYDINLLLSLISLGFFGGFYHCTLMCGPLVLSQIHNTLAKTTLDKYSNFKKISIISLLPYHLGRITTYSVTATIICYVRIKTDKALGVNNFISLFLIFIAILFFIKIFFSFNNIKINKYFDFLKINSFFLIKYTKNLFYIFFDKIIKKNQSLMKNSHGFNGYILGIILGFLPCGMLFQAYVIIANLSNFYLAFLSMFIFGIFTIPALFMVGYFGKLTIKLPEFKIIANIVIIFNIVNLINIFTKNFL